MSTSSKVITLLLLVAAGVALYFTFSPENVAPSAPLVPGASGAADAALAIPDAAEPATVNYVHDGDTIFLDTPRDSDLKVRLLAIDTPEIDTPSIGTDAIGDDAECFGYEARDYLRDTLPGGSTVYTLADTDETDQYGRALLFIWTQDGTFINLNLVASGYAEAVFIGNNLLYEDEFEAAEDAAQAGSLGRWGAC